MESENIFLKTEISFLVVVFSPDKRCNRMHTGAITQLSLKQTYSNVKNTTKF